MDLVKIGFQINANGLKDANTEVDKLLDKVDNIGTKGKKASSDFESSQKKVKDSTQQVTKEVDKTSKALEKQKIIGDYLGKGLDKTTATSIASFKQLGATVSQTNEYISNQLNNKGLEQTRKDLAQLSKEQQKQQEQQAKLVQDTVTQYEKLSNKSLGGGILDSIEQQNKGLEELKKQYRDQEKEAKKKADAEQKILDDAEKARQKAIDKQVKAQNTLNESNQKAITLEQAKAKYVSQGYGKTDSTRLARLEVSGADVTTLNNYKSAIEATTRATQALNPAVEKVTTSHSNFLDQVKGIAIYAALSAAIYGVMTAVTNLAVATVKMADEYTAIQNRMKLYIKDTQELAKVNSQLAQFSVENNVGLRETATLFTRLVPAMQKIGANTAAVTSVVDAFGKSMRIGGATAMEAASATIQFSQAMASGKLAGDEFRSISEASPRFLKAIADGSGRAAEQLKAMASAGELTTEVIAKALLKEYPKLIEENKKLGVTMEQGANAIKTGFLVAVGEFNEGAGITQALGESMMDLAKSMFTVGQGAREMGQEVNAWFKENSGAIQTVVETFKILTAVIVSRYVAAIVLARIESIRYQATLLSMAAAQAGAARSATVMSVAIADVGNAMKGVLAFFGGWVGLALTVAGTVASYVLFNKESEKTTESLRKEGESIDQAVAKYKELSRVKQLEQMVSEKKTVSDLTKEYDNQRQALVTNVLALSRYNDMSSTQAQALSQLGLKYKEGQITLSQLSNEINKSSIISQESKDKFNLLAGGVETSGNKAKEAEKLIKALGITTKGAGDEAEIAGSKFDKFLQDAENVTKTNQLALRYMKAFNLDQTKAVDLAKQDLALRSQGKYATIDHVKALQEQQKSEEALSAVTQSRNKAEKDLNKTRKESERDLKKFQNQVIEMTTYYDVLKRVNNLDIARIASQKEYINIYKGNLAVATELANIQEMTRREENRQEYTKSLREQIEQLGVIAELTKEGVDYETAKGLAAASFANDSSGREAAEKSIMNTLLGQSYALSDQITEQETLNRYLKEGMGIEEARFKVALSRVAKLSNGKNVYNQFGEDYENAMKSLRVKKATEASEIKINSILRESGILTKAIALGYTTSNIAVSKLAGATQGLLFSQAETQLKQQDELDLLYENAKARVKINSLLSGESETLRAVKEDYATIGDSEAERAVQLRKSLELAESYANKMKEQKANPLGDFSNVDFEVFGSFGNPFKEALDGLNAYVSGMTNLDEKIKTVQESMRQYQAEAELASLQGQTQRSQQLLDLANNQIAVEKDLQKEKAATIDIAYRQGLKFAKSFFKEESKGYKIINALEIALQAKKIAFALWEKKDTIKTMAIKLAGYAQDLGLFLSSVATKVAAQLGFNASAGIGAVLSAAQQPGPAAFVGFAAMAALVAGLGITIGGGGSSGGEYVDTSNQGTGTVFGDSEAQSASIANSIDLLSENSDLMLPLTSAMLRSLRNIESSIGGVTNLILRGELGGDFSNLEFDGKLTGVIGTANKIYTGISTTMMNVLTLGLDKLLLGGALGNLVSGIASTVFGGLFGKTSQEVVASGLYASDQKLSDILSNGLNLKQYADVETTTKSWFSSSSSTSTQYAAVDDEIKQQFTLIFGGFYDSILSATDILGADLSTVENNLKNAVVSIGKINLKGLSGEEIQEKLEAVFGAAADDLAKQAFGGLDEFQSVGEGYYETLVKVASAVEEAAYYTDRLNVTSINYTDIINKQADDLAAEIIRQSYLTKVGISTIKGGMTDLVNTFDGSAEEITDFINTLEDLQEQLFMTGKSGDYLTSSMILGAGGLDGLASGLDAYFEMLSPAEQAAELTRRLTNEFAIFGKELPADVKAFRNLVSSIDISSEAGQKLYGQIIALAPEFNDLQDALDSANSEVNALVQSLRDLAEQARAARGETEQPRNLAYLRSQFEQASVLAMQGDTASAEKLLTLGKDLMGLSKTYSVTGSEYARDLALIQRAATVSADIQEQGLGTSISTTLTPSTGTGTTTPTIVTTNSTMTTELKGMREELNVGLFAIAKFVQNVDSRTERWDDGNRVMVGIQPENGDTPVPVVVTP